MRFVLAALLVAFPALAQAQATIQQRFDAAEKLLTVERASEALIAFAALEADLIRAPKPNLRSLALSRVRKASALDLLARGDEAKASFRLALDGNALDMPALQGERDFARLSLARIHEFELDYAGAATEYELLRRSQSAASQVTALAGLARSTMFFDPPVAVGHAEAALALLPGKTEEDRKYVAAAHAVLGRTLLNAGRLPEARKAFDRAIALRGGLDFKVDSSEVTMRSDAAIAALLAGDSEAARKLLAYTGAGRSSTPLPPPRIGDVPVCGGLEALKPNDMAIVQFALLKDGSVAGATPVYSSRPGAAAIAFARAVQGWSWNPDSIAKVSIFDRQAARVELRCTNTVDRPSIATVAMDALARWFESKALPIDIGDTNATKRATASRAGLAERAPDSLAEAARLTELTFNPSVGWDETSASAKRALAIVRSGGAPAHAWIALAWSAVDFSTPAYSVTHRRKMRAHLEALLKDREVEADPIAAATLKLMLGNYHDAGEARALALAKEVTSDSRLAERHPVKIAALLTVANAASAKGDKAAAEVAYQRTGLTARQCATLDAPPRVKRSGASDSDFPMAAMRWGFEGWTRQEHDITADGRTTNIRTIAAYPPAVFAEASEGIAKGMRYEASFRPEGGLGCGGVTQRINFRLPD